MVKNKRIISGFYILVLVGLLSCSTKKEYNIPPIISIDKLNYIDFKLSMDSISRKFKIPLGFIDMSDYETFYYESDTCCENVNFGTLVVDSIGYFLVEKENELIGILILDKDSLNFNLGRIKHIKGSKIEIQKNKEFGYVAIYPLGKEKFMECVPPIYYSTYPFCLRDSGVIR